MKANRVQFARVSVGKWALAIALASNILGCQTIPPENDIRTEFNLYRPAVVLTYPLANDTRVNNHLALKEAINNQISKGEARQVVVVSKIGTGGSGVAMERAKKTAVLLLQSGEEAPRMYIRQVRQSERTVRSQGAVDVYVFPKSAWSDAAFVRIMKTDSLEIASLGGVLRSDVARVAMSEVFERRVITRVGLLKDQIESALNDVGWNVNFKNVPNIEGRSVQYVVSLPDDGNAHPMEAVTLVQRIGRQADVFGFNVNIDHENRQLVVSNGVYMGKGEGDEFK